MERDGERDGGIWRLISSIIIGVIEIAVPGGSWGLHGSGRREYFC
jgi:hypothetical protein